MNYLFLSLILIATMNPQNIFDFDENSSIQAWRIVDDGVMGGRSNGNFSLSPEGHGLFEGQISLENNGGFSSVRFQCDEVKASPESRITIRLKGDGKQYQFRVKDNSRNYYSYIISFDTSGAWEEVEIKLKDMYPSFRGRTLNMPNFAHDAFEEIVFLIGNKKAEAFKLLIDKIELK